MATAVAQDYRLAPQAAKMQPQQADKEPPLNIPEVIEEHRKDAEGKVTVHRYMRGKLLGKVSCTVL